VSYSVNVLKTIMYMRTARIILLHLVDISIFYIFIILVINFFINTVGHKYFLT